MTQTEARIAIDTATDLELGNMTEVEFNTLQDIAAGFDGYQAWRH